MRRFRLERAEDVNGVSGCGLVAEGVLWSDESVTLRWLGATPSTVVYNCFEDMTRVHLHGGRTVVSWIDQR